MNKHPNKLQFRGLLARLNELSDRAPNGARGHRVSISSLVAERAMASLIGMGVNYHPDLLRHDARLKVGVITEAEITENELLVRGHLFARDFPEVAKLLARSGRLEASAAQLGMSYEGTEVKVANMRHKEWVIEQIVFTGASILKRDSAAYGATWIELSE